MPNFSLLQKTVGYPHNIAELLQKLLSTVYTRLEVSFDNKPVAFLQIYFEDFAADPLISRELFLDNWYTDS